MAHNCASPAWHSERNRRRQERDSVPVQQKLLASDGCLNLNTIMQCKKNIVFCQTKKVNIIPAGRSACAETIFFCLFCCCCFLFYCLPCQKINPLRINISSNFAFCFWKLQTNSHKQSDCLPFNIRVRAPSPYCSLQASIPYDVSSIITSLGNNEPLSLE